MPSNPIANDLKFTRLKNFGTEINMSTASPLWQGSNFLYGEWMPDMDFGAWHTTRLLHEDGSYWDGNPNTILDTNPLIYNSNSYPRSALLKISLPTALLSVYIE